MCISVSTRTLKHVTLNSIQKLLHLICKLLKGYCVFLTGISSAENSLAVLNILRTTLNTDRNTTHLLLCKLESRALVCIVNFRTDPCCLQCCKKLICFLHNTLFTLLDRNDHSLYRCDSRRKDKTAVVAVNHDDGTDHTGCHSPGCLMNIFQCVIFICILDSKCLCKTISEVMACTGLKSLAVMHQGLNGVSSLRTCKLLLVSFLSADNRNSQNLLAEICIQVQHLDGTLLSLLSSSMSSMALLPQELPGTKERTGCLLPAHNRAPLVVYLRKISVGLDLFLVEVTEQSL